MLKEHLGYVADSIRLKRFQSAVARVVKPGHLVADLGCGSGVLGLLCLRAGAAHVISIDATAMIEITRETLQRADLSDRVSFIRGRSERITLPHPVDVVICDHVGFFGFDYGILHVLQDARRRFLKPGGSLIPASVTLSLGAVESASCRAHAEGWRGDVIPSEFHWLRHQAINTKYDVELKREEVLGEPSVLGDIDFTKDNPDFLSWTADLRMSRDGIMHGLAGWFDCELADGVWMTNSPLAEDAIDRPQAFLPIDEAIAVKAGELVKATILARPG